MVNLISIAIGAIIGTILRYGLNLYTLASGYPYGTIIENITGSLLLGGLTGYFAMRSSKEWVKLGLGVGLCGGFTTFSTLAADSVFVYSDLTLGHAALYVGVTIFGGILTAMIGYILGQDFASKRMSTKGRTRS
ncbi:CrcB family protein [Bacillus sp. FJAT-44742]|uniref:CrcB family protein n=1 Tax=Bacillus sp. FJAT-44742 TaxID=2014005 RepID=UPI000C23E96C|nr:CrcB family protein [Bacillus sp. FJAT-44742]